MNKITELYGIATDSDVDWHSVVSAQQCPFLQRKCLEE
jgi:hypothetical protein